MSKSYYTEGNIDESSRAFLEELGRFRKHHQLTLRSGEYALLIIDMQKHYLSQESRACIPSALPIVGRISRLAAAAGDAGGPVIATRHSNRPGDAGMMEQWWPALLTPDAPGVEIIPQLLPLCDTVVDKERYDAFRGTRLIELREESGVSQLIITGVMTNLCCESTTRAAFDLGFECFFTVDCTAAYTADFHRASLLNLSFGCAVPVLSSELIGMMEEGGRGQ